MSEYFDSDDPFEDVTAEDLDIIEHKALAATQGYAIQQPALQPRLPIARSTSFQNAIPQVQDNPNMEDDYGHFNVDDEDLVLVDQADFPSFPAPTQEHPRPSFADDALVEELVQLRAETARLKQERDKFETLAFRQEGKMDHLQRTLTKSRAEHEAALLRLQNATEAEKRTFQNAIAERDRRLTALTADIEFQRNELREAQELANRGTTIRTTNNIQLTSPKRPARVVKGSGVKSPESKNRIGVFSAIAFGKDEAVVTAKSKKRKRGEPVPEKPFVMVEEPESSGLSEGEINRIVMEKVFRERSSWTSADERFELMRDILAHRMMDGTETFSALSTLTFKTENHAISSIVIHEITTRAVNADNESNLAKLLCHVLSEQWNRCLKEEVVCTPFDKTNIVHTSDIPSITDKLSLPAKLLNLRSTLELHASKRIYNKDTPQLPYSAVTSSLDILYTIACGLPTDDEVVHFWEILSVNFTVMSLHTKQLVPTIEGMAKLLGLSVTSDGFGPRGEFEDDGVQRDPVTLVLDKLTLNLIEEPRAGCSKEELWHLRQTIVETMSELVAGHSHGSKILHSSGFVLSRLIGLLANEIEYYYAHPLDAVQSIGLSKSCIRLLHAIIMPHSPDTLSHHLSPFPGAQQAHNVAMTRLSFGGESETVFIDVADMARDLLEAAVSPEEGDGIWSLFQWGEEMDEDDTGEDLSAFMM